jgi:hypothetical protein
MHFLTFKKAAWVVTAQPVVTSYAMDSKGADPHSCIKICIFHTMIKVGLQCTLPSV